MAFKVTFCLQNKRKPKKMFIQIYFGSFAKEKAQWTKTFVNSTDLKIKELSKKAWITKTLAGSNEFEIKLIIHYANWVCFKNKLS